MLYLYVFPPYENADSQCATVTCVACAEGVGAGVAVGAGVGVGVGVGVGLGVSVGVGVGVSGGVCGGGALASRGGRFDPDWPPPQAAKTKNTAQTQRRSAIVYL